MTKYLTLGLFLIFSLSVSACSPETSSEIPNMVVYKSPTCECCQKWVDYIEQAGISVTTINSHDMNSIKSKHGLHNDSLKSCHTAIINDYVIEGHVPISDIKRLLEERPDIIGLTAPGMPMMSPGMNSLIPSDYDVLAFDKSNTTSIYSSY